MSAEIEFQDEQLRELLSGYLANFKLIQNGYIRYQQLLSAIVYPDIINHFEKQSGPMGKWTRWSDSYKIQMARLGKENNLILQDSGRLRQNFKPQSVRTTKEGILWFNDAKTKKGFPYAFAHNEGGPKLPKREFMWLSDDAMEKVEEQSIQFFFEGV